MEASLNVRVKKTYTWPTIPHYSLSLKLTLVKIDAWDPPEKVFFGSDGIDYAGIAMAYLPNQEQICERSNYELETTLAYSSIRTHSADSVTFDFWANSDLNNEC
jgi:hypothetical protein